MSTFNLNGNIEFYVSIISDQIFSDSVLCLVVTTLVSMRWLLFYP